MTPRLPLDPPAPASLTLLDAIAELVVAGAVIATVVSLVSFVVGWP